jgi:hypothetical protein
MVCSLSKILGRALNLASSPRDGSVEVVSRGVFDAYRMTLCWAAVAPSRLQASSSFELGSRRDCRSICTHDILHDQRMTRLFPKQRGHIEGLLW